MRLGDVFQEANPGEWQCQCRGCNRWLKADEREKVGDCGRGCCDDVRCKACGHVTRIEWPD